jgi:hypothetical protein
MQLARTRVRSVLMLHRDHLPLLLLVLAGATAGTTARSTASTTTAEATTGLSSWCGGRHLFSEPDRSAHNKVSILSTASYGILLMSWTLSSATEPGFRRSIASAVPWCPTCALPKKMQSAPFHAMLHLACCPSMHTAWFPSHSRPLVSAPKFFLVPPTPRVTDPFPCSSTARATRSVEHDHGTDLETHG